MNRSHLAVFMVVVTAALTRLNAAQLENAVVSEQPAGSGPAEAVRHANVQWVAWEVPSNDPSSLMCCFDSIDQGRRSKWTGGTCSLSRRSGFMSGNRSAGEQKSMHDQFTVFIRVENGEASEVRMFSGDCHVDAGGASVLRLIGVHPEQSVNYLVAVIDGPSLGREKKGWRDAADQAIGAIAMHRAANTIESLETLVRGGREGVAARAAFWLGMKGGPRGRETLRQAINESPSDNFRDQAIAGIAQGEDAGAVDLLLKLARTHPSAEVRRKSIFWLGQKAGSKASADLKEAANDEDDDVKEMAVFAISQLPRERSVPDLIQLARTHKSRAVREKAIFWLGQSGDPRALDFIEAVLTK